jgi:uncharacterized membrane protein
MSARLRFALTLFSALGSGLIAGVFFAFSALLMSALARLPPAQGIAAMQSIIIIVVSKPLFLVVFVGTAVTCVLLAISSLSRWHEPAAVFLLVGAVLYLAGTFLVTIAFNVPLNYALAAVDPASAVGASLWTRFISSWTAWNHVRAAAALAAAASFIVALARGPRRPAS